MRSDWQSHCLVITVWWTSIVFRLVETEACWASARSTNANLFHVDIISHCLLSNHNTCLTFFPFFLHNGNVLPGSLFYFGSQAGGNQRGDSGEIICVMLDVEVYSSNTVSEWCGGLFFFSLQKEKKDRKQKLQWFTAEGDSQRVPPNVTWYVRLNPPLLDTSPAVHHEANHQHRRWR